ncbi:MAG: hypothetical protein LC108_08335 [Anaerolineales bacterium]|nr:hypothetical protein [Anaerolineales bacterium]
MELKRSASVARLERIDKGSNDPNWDTARMGLIRAMAKIFEPIGEFALPEESDQKELNTFLTLFSGFTSVADWIGSMTEFFPYEKSVNIPLEEYTARAASNAEKALTDLGWFNWRADGKALTFKEMFPSIVTPNSVQQTLMDEVSKTQLPAMLILESPTEPGRRRKPRSTLPTTGCKPNLEEACILPCLRKQPATKCTIA